MQGQNVWLQKASYPGISGSFSACFVMNNKAYVGGGVYTTSGDFYEYDYSSDTWTAMANIPSDKRKFKSFALGSYGYVVTSDSLFRYDIPADTWQGMGVLPFSNADNSKTAFSLNGKGYAVLGNDSTVWEYDAAANAWTQKNNGPKAIADPASFIMQNKVYFVGGEIGSSHISDVWQYSPQTDQWVPKAGFPGYPRSGSAGFSINDKGYLGLGIGVSCTNDFWEYNDTTDSWQQIDSIAETCNFGAVGFSIANSGFIVNGCEPFGGYLPYFGLWEYTKPSLVMNANESNRYFKIYPNPASGYFVVSGPVKGLSQIVVAGTDGKIVWCKNSFTNDQVIIDGSRFCSGLYNIIITGDNFVESEKIVIEKH